MLNYICDVLEDCIRDFESRIDNNRETSIKLHKDLVTNLENKLKTLEKKEEMQWEAQYDPDPEKRMPMDIFKRLNEKLRKEKEEIKKALCEAYESMPQPVDYKEKVFISICAGVTISSIEALLPQAKIIRTMPNTPLMLGQGVTAICKNESVSQGDFDFIKSVFSSSGYVTEILEKDINSLTSVTSQ